MYSRKNVEPKMKPWREDLKPHWKSEKRPHFSFLAAELSPTFLNKGATNKTFQQSRKQDSLRRLLKISADIYESSSSKFFRTTTEI